MLIHNLVATGSLSYNGVNISYVTGSQTSLDGLNQFSASVNTTTGSLNTATGSLFTASGSFSTRVTKIEGNYVTTGSNTFIGTQIITGSVLITSSLSVTGCIVSTGQIVAQTLNVQQVTSSIVYSSGSNTFGCSITDVQQMTGSVRITGSLSTVGVSCFSSAVCAPTIIGTTNINTGTSCIVDSHMLNVNGDQASVNVGLSLRNINATYPKVFGLTNVNGNLNLYDYTANSQRLRIDTNGIACFACQKCAPGMDIMPSGIGVSTLGGIMRVVTTGTSTGIAVGQSNSNRYTHFAANDIQVFNDDYFITTRCAFPLSIGTCYTARLTFAATGIACFSCQVCAPLLYINGTSGYITSDTACGTVFELYGGSITGTDCGLGIGFTRQGSQLGYIKTARECSTNEASYMIFATQTGAGFHPERMRITSCGYVGIGLVPTLPFHVCGGSSQVASFAKYINGDGINTSFVNLCSIGYSSYIYIGSAPGLDWKLGKNITNTSTCTYFQIGDSNGNSRIQIATTGVVCFNCPISINRDYNASYGNLQITGLVDAFDNNAVYRVWNAAASFAGGSGTDAWAFSGNNTDYAIYGNNDLYLYSNGSRRLKFTGNGIACFACTVCAPIFTTVNGVAAVAAGPSTTDIFTATGPVSSNGMYLILYNQQGAPGGSTGMAFINIWNNASVDVYNVYCLGLSNVVNSGTTIRIQSLAGNGGFTAVYSAIRLR